MEHVSDQVASFAHFEHKQTFILFLRSKEAKEKTENSMKWINDQIAEIRTKIAETVGKMEKYHTIQLKKGRKTRAIRRWTVDPNAQEDDFR